MPKIIFAFLLMQSCVSYRDLKVSANASSLKYIEVGSRTQFRVKTQHTDLKNSSESEFSMEAAMKEEIDNAAIGSSGGYDCGALNESQIGQLDEGWTKICCKCLNKAAKDLAERLKAEGVKEVPFDGIESEWRDCNMWAFSQVTCFCPDALFEEPFECGSMFGQRRKAPALADLKLLKLQADIRRATAADKKANPPRASSMPFGRPRIKRTTKKPVRPLTAIRPTTKRRPPGLEQPAPNYDGDGIGCKGPGVKGDNWPNSRYCHWCNNNREDCEEKHSPCVLKEYKKPHWHFQCEKPR